MLNQLWAANNIGASGLIAGTNGFGTVTVSTSDLKQFLATQNIPVSLV